jgi:hypothetical protein
MPLTPTSTNDGIVLTDLSVAIAPIQDLPNPPYSQKNRGMAMSRRQRHAPRVCHQLAVHS